MFTIEGKQIAITGQLKNFTHPEAYELIRRAGATVCTKVTSKTAYLVVGRAWSDGWPSSREMMARTHGTPMIDEAGMLALIAQAN